MCRGLLAYSDLASKSDSHWAVLYQQSLPTVLASKRSPILTSAKFKFLHLHLAFLPTRLGSKVPLLTFRKCSPFKRKPMWIKY